MASSVYYPAAMIRGLTVFDSFGSDVENPLAVNFPPIELTINRNSYKEPDSFSATFDKRQMPINPKQIKSMAVEIYLYNRTHVNEPLFFGQEQEFVDNLDVRAPIFTGIVEEVVTTDSADGSFVTIRGVDYTAIFSYPGYPDARMPGGVSVKRGLEKVMAELEGAKALKLELLGTDGSDILPKVAANTKEKEKDVDSVITSGDEQKPKKKKKAGFLGSSVKAGDSYWDVMYEMARRTGHVLFVELDKVVLTRPKVLTEQRQSDIATMVWGKNIDTLELSRAMGKERTPVVRVSSYAKIKGRRKTIWGQFPRRGKRAKEGVGTARDQRLDIFVQGIPEEKTLRKMAETVYALRARGEFSLRLRTRDLTTFSAGSLREARRPIDDPTGQNRDFDLLALRTGSPILIVWESFIATMESLSAPQRVEYLEDRGYQHEVAKLVADNYDKLDLLNSPFRVREVSYSWGADSGLDIEIEASEFINFPEEYLAKNN